MRRLMMGILVLLLTGCTTFGEMQRGYSRAINGPLPTAQAHQEGVR